MDPIKLVEFNQTMLKTIHNMYRMSLVALTALGDQAEKMLRSAQKQQVEAYSTTAHILEEWLTTMRNGQETFRKLVDESFARARENLEEPPLGEDNGGREDPA